MDGWNRRRQNLVSRAIFLIRIMVGSVFLSEGIQKFLFPETLGVGRFVTIGVPYPSVAAPFVGVVEVVCGLLILFGFFTRLATLPLLIDILTAISSTKIPMLLSKGFWPAVHEARVDWCMCLGLLFLLMVGPGRTSIDFILDRRRGAIDIDR